MSREIPSHADIDWFDKTGIDEQTNATKPSIRLFDLRRVTSSGWLNRVAQWIDRKGKRRSAELTNGGDRIKEEAATWTAKYRDGEGVVCEVATGCRDKQAAQSVLDELMRRAELVKAKVLSPDQDRAADHERTPLADHLAEYIDHQKKCGVNYDRLKTTETRMKLTSSSSRWRWLADMNVASLERWLETLTEETTNHESPAKLVSAAVYNGTEGKA